MRVGRNPAKFLNNKSVDVVAPPPITVGLLTHVPFLAGYHTQQLDVIKLCVLTAKAHADQPIHLIVVDNASCTEARTWLLQALDHGHIDQLILNQRNLGKITAVSQILLGSPGPDVIYADGDLRFLPNWLTPITTIRDTFPEAGIIGGAPALPGNHGPADRGSERGDVDAPDDTVTERGRFVSDEHIRTLLSDTGLEGDALEERLALVRETDDVRIRRDGHAALWGASHCQYMVTAAARAGLEVHVGGKALNSQETHDFDRELDRQGKLRLSVTEPVYRHVGNRLSDDDRAELERLTNETVRRQAEQSTLRSSFWGLTPVRRMVRKVHTASFRVLYESDPKPRRSGPR